MVQLYHRCGGYSMNMLAARASASAIALSSVIICPSAQAAANACSLSGCVRDTPQFYSAIPAVLYRIQRLARLACLESG
jgi:hypothetical protein